MFYVMKRKSAVLKYLKLFAQPHIITMTKIRERVNENVRIYFCSRSSKEMGYFRKTGTEAVRGKTYTRRGKVQSFVAYTKGRRKTD